jgi:integrase
VVGKVLTASEKRMLFETAASKQDWMVVYCAAVLAVNTTCRSVELRHLRWRDVDLFGQVMNVRRSKTQAGHRSIPLNTDASAALGRLLQRAEIHGASQPEHFVFPACEHERIDPTRPQQSWRSAWRALLRETARRAGRLAATIALEAKHGIG